jgi:hypothetical protein
VLLLLTSLATASAQTPSNLNVAQSAINNLANLPEADALIYANPQRVFSEAAPKVMTPADLTKMREGFAEIKKAVGIDPGTIDTLVVALRFRKPSAELKFSPPEVLAVVNGDFSSESLMTLARIYLQDRARDEKHGAKTLTILKIEEIAKEAEKISFLKAYSEIAIASLGVNTIALGNIEYVKAALDAADGTNRISAPALNSLMRDPTALVSAAGSPLAAFAKSFGMRGTETTPRDPRCETVFGNFYAAVSMQGSSFVLRGAMNADNPDTAKIINGLFSGLMSEAVDAIPDKTAQSVLKQLTLSAKESEVVVEATVPDQVVADLIRTKATENKTTNATSAPATPKKTQRRRRRR